MSLVIKVLFPRDSYPLMRYTKGTDKVLLMLEQKSHINAYLVFKAFTFSFNSVLNFMVSVSGKT